MKETEAEEAPAPASARTAVVMKDGLLLLDKGPGYTSHDAVQRVRRLLKQKRIGHCGTLDPEATGLLLLTLGSATRLTRFLIRAPKVYCGTIRFGTATDTYDASGQVVSRATPAELAELRQEPVVAAMATFVGQIEQKAPPYSAKKINGVRYYELARRGEEVPADPKEVTVFEFVPLSELADGAIRFRLACSSGTYARALAHDLGAALGVGAHLAELRRLQIGSFHADAGVTLERLETELAAGERPGAAWLPFDEIPLPFAEVTVDAQQEQRIRHGQTVLARDLGGAEGDWVKLVNRRREFIAVGTVVERIGNGGVGVVQPKVVFH
ncbi:MAG TPA: tRNA pseudouridine(55) synthase TruB [Thermoanaerobaculia bacterium]|nr:tRNA pseudouridine(55) synthase TruB [Thermoanaerobaculia bacterium]